LRILGSSLLGIGLFLTFINSSASGQDIGRASQLTRGPGQVSDAKPRVIINPVFATGMKCDGATDDSSALQSALNAASISGPGNVAVILPPGTCVIDPAVNITINSALWLQGAGRFGTTLKRKDASAGVSILQINSNGITFSDFAIDGNKGGPGITADADSIAANAPFSGITIQRMRFLNSTHSDIASYALGAGAFIADWLISENQFDNGGTAACIASVTCGNLMLHQPLRMSVFGNTTTNSGHFALFSSIPGGGQVEVGQNIANNISGYFVALGGGVLGSAGAHLHDNFIVTNKTYAWNIFDLAFWSDFNVDHNTMYYTGGFASSTGVPAACIADFPPANHGEIDGNICYLSAVPSDNVLGISVGGSDVSITNNFIQGASTAGIGFAVSSLGPARGLRIIGNTCKNNSQGSPGTYAGIDLYLGVVDGTTSLAALSDVVIQGNHSYDDQLKKTQGYGIGIGFGGMETGFRDVLIEGNDLAGNLHSGILSAPTSIPGLVIRNNFGFNPVGAVPPPDFPASGAGPIVNTTGYDVNVYITSGSNPITFAINGVTLSGVTVPGGGAVSIPIRLAANQNITVNYTAGGTPGWQWIGD
jgi:Pectate lyase superfamily protein